MPSCQISPAPDEMVVVADKLTFDLSMLHNLELLLVDSIDIHQLQGRSSLPGQIHALEIRRSLGSLKVKKQDCVYMYGLGRW